MDSSRRRCPAGGRTPSAASAMSRAEMSLAAKTAQRLGSDEIQARSRAMRSPWSSQGMPSNTWHCPPALAHRARKASTRSWLQQGIERLGTAAKQGGSPADSSRKAAFVTATLSHTTDAPPHGARGSIHTTGVSPKTSGVESRRGRSTRRCTRRACAAPASRAPTPGATVPAERPRLSSRWLSRIDRCRQTCACGAPRWRGSRNR